MTRYELFRKRIAPVLFLGMVGLIAYDSCRSQGETLTGTLVLDVGDAAPRVRLIEGELLVDGEPAGVLLCRPQVAPCKFEVRMPSPEGQLKLTADVGEPARRRIARIIHLTDGATLRVDLARDLAP